MYLFLTDLPAFGRGFQVNVTKQQGFNKKGSFGHAQRFLTNYYHLQIKKTVTFRIYTATFDPELDHIPKRKALMRTMQPVLGAYIFDGVQFFTNQEIDPGNLTFQVSFPDHAEDNWTVKLDFVRDCQPSEPVAAQLFNTLLKKAQELLELNLMGRFYFDANGKIEIRNHKLQIWPGFITSMRQMEQQVTLTIVLCFCKCIIFKNS